MKNNQSQIKIFRAEEYYKRIDVYLNNVLEGYSRGEIQRFIIDNKVKLNNKIITKKNTSVNQNDKVEISIVKKPERTVDFKPTIQLKILFEDEYLLVIDKPIDLAVHHGASKNKQETILDILLFNYPQVGEDSETDRQGIVHRIDKETSGVLILAKNEKTRISLQEQFKKREIVKNYLAISHGKLRFLQGKIEKPIIRSLRQRTLFTVTQNDNLNARYALSYYKLLYQFSNFCWVRLSPFTGRTHQLRVHMKSLGNPILGDSKYGKPKDYFHRLALHAYSIEFIHPYSNNKITVYSHFPKDLMEFLKKLYINNL